MRPAIEWTIELSDLLNFRAGSSANNLLAFTTSGDRPVNWNLTTVALSVFSLGFLATLDIIPGAGLYAAAWSCSPSGNNLHWPARRALAFVLGDE
jgi:hypothetical protein